MMRKCSSTIRIDIDLNGKVVEDLKEMLISQEVTNKKVAHKQREHKRIMVMVANTSQRKSSKEIATTAERGAR